MLVPIKPQPSRPYFPVKEQKKNFQKHLCFQAGVKEAIVISSCTKITHTKSWCAFPFLAHPYNTF